MKRGITRRQVLLGALAGHCAAAGSANTPILRAIPSTGERLPVVGIGTNAFDVSAADDIAQRREVLEAMPGLGMKLIDTARGYGLSEQVIGRLLENLGTRDRFFLATKPISAPQANADLTPSLVDESFAALRVKRIDLLQVHSLVRLDDLLPRYQEYKQAGRIRYLGITTANRSQYPQVIEALRRHRVDFLQVNYSIDDRSAADRILPMARDRGLAVLNNMPFGGRNGSLFPRLAGKTLPTWAEEFDARSWAQFMLKYNLSHPAITVAIPGTTNLAYLRDNQQGGCGRLPDAALRRRMEEFWANL